MMTKCLFWCMAGIAAVALGACDGTVVNRSEVAGGYTGFLYTQSQAANGTNAVTVRNAPFPPDAVVSALRSPIRATSIASDLAQRPQTGTATRSCSPLAGRRSASRTSARIPTCRCRQRRAAAPSSWATIV